MDWTIMTNLGIAGAAFAVSMIGLLISLAVRHPQKAYKSFFVVIFSLLTAYTASNLVLWNVPEEPVYTYMIINYISLFFESLFSSMLMPVLTMFLLFCAGKDWKRDPFMHTAVGIWAVYFTLLVTAQFTKAIYYYTPENEYCRGPLYPILLIPPVLLMAINLFALFRLRRDLSLKYRKAFAGCFLVPLICMVIQMFYSGLLLTVIGTAVAAMIMLLIIIIDQSEQTLAKEKEIARQRANITVLQMRPHFIYNTMTSIYYLIEQDADKAQKLTKDFTNYLRKNLAAIAKEETIPFAEELEHTKVYLSIEQVRFEGKLFVEFDTPHTTFRLPPLTLQPIVENAVKHGIGPDLKPLTITVRTRLTDNSSEITVEDTGAGFSDAVNNEPHIALDNIRERLDIMCQGTLTIAPREGGGTRVSIRIPCDKKARTKSSLTYS